MKSSICVQWRQSDAFFLLLHCGLYPYWFFMLKRSREKKEMYPRSFAKCSSHLEQAGGSLV